MPACPRQNLRRLFPGKTLRNFVLYTTPEIDPRLGSYDFREICQAVQHRLELDGVGVAPKKYRDENDLIR